MRKQAVPGSERLSSRVCLFPQAPLVFPFKNYTRHFNRGIQSWFVGKQSWDPRVIAKHGPILRSAVPKVNVR